MAGKEEEQQPRPLSYRESKALARARIAEAWLDPFNPELIDRAQDAVDAVGISRRSKNLELYTELSKAAERTWEENRAEVKRSYLGLSVLSDMIDSGETRIAILVKDFDQIEHAEAFRDKNVSHRTDQDNIDVRILIDPRRAIPTGGTWGTRRVVNFYKHR